MTQAVSLAQGGSNNVTMRNRIINGGMVVNQRGFTTGAPANPGGGGFTYITDRFSAYVSQTSKMTFGQSTVSASGFINSLNATTTTAYSVPAGELFLLSQPIEGLNVADFGWGTASAATVTLSFWVRSSLTGTFGGSILNSAVNRSYPFSYTVSSANTWEQKSITIAGDTSGTWLTTNGVGLYLSIGLGVGSTYSGTAGAWSGSQYWSATGATSVVGTNGATFYITGVQLEAGTTATPFEQRLYGTELTLCQRYFEKSFDQSVAPAHNTGGLPVIPIGSSLGCGGNAYWTIPFKVSKRVNTFTTRWYDPSAAHTASENWVRAITTCDAGTAYGPNSNMQINAVTTNQLGGYSQVGTGVPPIFYWTVDAEL